MKTIEERAKAYARKIWANGKRDYAPLKKMAEQDFSAGAQSEHEELTRWHDPKEPPSHTNTVLLKLENENGYVSYTLRRFMFGRVWGRPIHPDYKVVGWRPIHENK